MSGIDIVLILLLLLSIFKGWRSGAFAMLLSIASIVVAGILASLFATKAGMMLGIGPPSMHSIVGFFFVFLVCMVLCSALIRMVKPKVGLLHGLDSLVGAFLGLIRGAFILSAILLLLRMFHLPPIAMRRDSKLYTVVLKTAPTVVHTLKPLVPSSTPSTDSTSEEF